MRLKEKGFADILCLEGWLGLKSHVSRTVSSIERSVRKCQETGGKNWEIISPPTLPCARGSRVPSAILGVLPIPLAMGGSTPPKLTHYVQPPRARQVFWLCLCEFDMIRRAAGVSRPPFSFAL